MILWESEGRDSLHLAHCTSLLKKGASAAPKEVVAAGEVVLVCEHGRWRGAFAIVPPPNEGKGKTVQDGRREGAKGDGGHQRL